MSALWSIRGASSHRELLDEEQLDLLGDRRGQDASLATLRVAVTELAEARGYALNIGGTARDWTAMLEERDGQAHLLVTAYNDAHRDDRETFFCQGWDNMVEELAAQLAQMCGPQIISVDGDVELVMPEEEAA